MTIPALPEILAKLREGIELSAAVLPEPQQADSLTQKREQDDGGEAPEKQPARTPLSATDSGGAQFNFNKASHIMRLVGYEGTAAGRRAIAAAEAKE